MQNVLSVRGQAVLAEAMRLRPLLAFDFDGTLAPTVSRPDDAHVSVALARRLDQLSRLLPVAIVSGRRIDDVAPRLGFEPQFIIGNHGAEDDDAPHHAAAARALEAVRARLQSHAARLQAAGVDVEDKRYSVALHYRLAHDRHEALGLISAVLDGAQGETRVFAGKCVVNVVPHDAPDKGDAVASLVERCGSASVVFVGDDVNDEQVFVRSQPHWLTIRVGRNDPGSHARYFLDGTAEVGILLHRMLACVAPQ